MGASRATHSPDDSSAHGRWATSGQRDERPAPQRDVTEGSLASLPVSPAPARMPRGHAGLQHLLGHAFNETAPPPVLPCQVSTPHTSKHFKNSITEDYSTYLIQHMVHNTTGSNKPYPTHRPQPACGPTQIRKLCKNIMRFFATF